MSDITVIVLFILFFALIGFILFFAIRRAVRLGKNAKTGNKIEMTVIDGIPNIPNGMLVEVSHEQDGILITEAIPFSEKTASIKYSQITDFGDFTEKQVTEITKNKSVVGRAVGGGLLLGPLGAIIGGMSGIGDKTKTKVEYTSYFVINFTSSNDSEPKVVSFGMTANTWGLSNFTNNLSKKTGIKKEPVLNDVEALGLESNESNIEL